MLVLAVSHCIMIYRNAWFTQKEHESLLLTAPCTERRLAVHNETPGYF